MRIGDAHRVELLGYLLDRDAAAATDLVVALLDEGIPVPQVLTGLLAPALAEIGERWQRNEISVADEHAATAVADAVLSILGALPAGAGDGLHVVVACAEDEWHLFPARLVSEVLRSEGHEVSFLGGSMPPAHLARFLGSAGADLVALSCSTPLALGGLVSSIAVGHDAGLPVLVGGRALGPDDHRATLLGADLWAPDGPAAAALLAEPLPDQLRTATADVGTVIDLGLQRDALADAALDELGRRFPPVRGYDDRQLARTREDLRYILQHAEAAILVDDPRLFDGFRAWLASVLRTRGLPDEAIELSLASLSEAAAGTTALVELLRRR